MKTLMIDVDDTIVNMIDDFKKHISTFSSNDNYYELSQEEQEKAMSFWKNDKLYENKVPDEGAVEAIAKLAKRYNVYFCSACIIEHKKSKEEFLDRHFKGIPLVDTHHKHVCKPDIAIDDRIEVLNKMSSKTFCIHKKTSMNKKDKFSYFSDWKSIEEVLLNKYY